MIYGIKVLLKIFEDYSSQSPFFKSFQSVLDYNSEISVKWSFFIVNLVFIVSSFVERIKSLEQLLFLKLFSKLKKGGK